MLGLVTIQQADSIESKEAQVVRTSFFGVSNFLILVLLVVLLYSVKFTLRTCQSEYQKFKNMKTVGNLLSLVCFLTLILHMLVTIILIKKKLHKTVFDVCPASWRR